MVNVFIGNEYLKEMADTLRPVIKYAKQRDKTRLKLQNVCFSTDGAVLVAVATDGNKLLRYRFSSEAADTSMIDGHFHAVVRFDDLEKIVKAFSDSEFPFKVTFSIEANEDELKLLATDEQGRVHISTPVKFSYDDSVTDVDWDALDFVNWKHIYDNTYTDIQFGDSQETHFSSANMKSLSECLVKSGVDTFMLSGKPESTNLFVASTNGKVTGVFMTAGRPRDERDEEDSLIPADESGE